MNLVQLRHLVALAEAGSFSRAAAAVHLSQPALSRSIQALESDLDLNLVDRVGRRLEITAAGRTVIERARRLVADAADLRHIAQHLAGGAGGTLAVGLGSGPGAVLGSALLAHFAREHPGVRLALSSAPTEMLLTALRERTLDALVVDALSVRPASDLNIERLAPMRAGFMVRAGHPLARRRRLALAQLRAYPIASSPLSDEVARGLVALYGPQAHPDQMISLVCNDLQSARDAALASDAIYLGISASARAALASRRMVELDVAPRQTQAAHFGLVTLAARADPPLLDPLRGWVRAQMVDPPLPEGVTMQPPVRKAPRPTKGNPR